MRLRVYSGLVIQDGHTVRRWTLGYAKEHAFPSYSFDTWQNAINYALSVVNKSAQYRRFKPEGANWEWA